MKLLCFFGLHDWWQAYNLKFRRNCYKCGIGEHWIENKGWIKNGNI